MSQIGIFTNTTKTAHATNATNTTNITNVTNTTANTANSSNTKILSKIDRRLLDIICPAYSDKDLATSSKEETTQEPDGPEGLEEHYNSLDKKNEAFIEQVQDFLPIFIEGRTTEEYAGSLFLRSAALQLSVELKKYYRNEAIDLRSKIEVLRRKNLLPPEARGHINPQRSAIENFILLNRACGSGRSL
ncbi:hypothetical protein BGZ47_007564, partial [Haplosporangium gracile]